MSAEDKLYISCYQNNPSSDNLCKLIQNIEQCNFVLLSWNLENGYWYISCINDINIGLLSDGWHLDKEPTIDNIPVLHSKINDPIVYSFNNCKIITDKEINNSRLHLVQMFAEKLRLTNLIVCQKTKLELLLSNISHAIQTPLNGILYMTNQIANNQNNQSDDMNYLMQSSISLANNVFDIIDMSKLEMKQIKIEKEVFDLREIIQNAVDIVKNVGKNDRVSIEHYIEMDVPEFIYSDSKRFKQIIVNILENAVHNTVKGEISLYVRTEIVEIDNEDQYQLSVIIRDTGMGIEEELKNSVFKPSELVGNAKQQGISLRVSYLLAHALGGQLSLKDSQLCKGSVFEFSIIVPQDEPRKNVTKTMKALKNKSILVIDEIDNRSVIQKLSEKYEFIITFASSTDEVDLLFNDEKYDLVVTQRKFTEKKQEIQRDNQHNNQATTHDVLRKISGDDYQTDYQNDTHYSDLIIYDDELTFTNYKGKLLDALNSDVSFTHVNKHKIKLLVVEDERINRIVIEKMLRVMGYSDITIVTNGLEAIDTYIKNNYDFDVILLDIRMPGMSGLELADHLHDINPQVKLLGVTAQIINEVELRPWLSTFVYKPINRHELDDKIMKMLE